MRFLLLLFSLLISFSPTVAQSTDLGEAIQSLPQCAQICLLIAVVSSPCNITDTSCTCNNVKLQHDAEVCVLRSCSVREALTSKNITATICHAPTRYRGRSMKISNLTLVAITTLIGISRLIYKALFSVADLGWDDYAVLASMILGAPSVVIVDRSLLPNGFGRDIWTIPFYNITNFIRWLYVLGVLYFIQIALVKTTLLFFFLKIFPKPHVRRLLLGTVAFCVTWGSIFTVVSIFQCRPISYNWTSWDTNGQHSGKCIDVNGLAWSNAAISLLLDIWMLAIPLYQVFQLQLTWRKKISVSVMFCVGTFVTVVSILRLKYLVTFANSRNPTWDQFTIIQWSNTEIMVGVLCPCLPTLRVMLAQAFPVAFGTSNANGQSYGNSRSQGFKRSCGATEDGPRKGAEASNGDAKLIAFSRTSEVQHADNDETALVQMHEWSPKRSKAHSSRTSLSSV